MKPFVLSILPANSALSLQLTASRAGGAVAAAQPRIQVRSSLSLSTVQTLSHPFSELSQDEKGSSVTAAPTLASQGIAMRLLTASPGAKSPAFLLTTPTDKTTATAQGSTIWLFTMQDWGEQIDELVDAGNYNEALILLNTLDPVVLENKVSLAGTLAQLQR